MKQVRKLTLNIDSEEIRYVNYSRHASSRPTMTVLADNMVHKTCFLLENPALGTMTQITFGFPDHGTYDCAMQTAGGILRYDIWAMWSSSAGQQVADKTKKWAMSFDKSLQDCFIVESGCGLEGNGHQAFPSSTMETDISFLPTRKLYYPDDDFFERLQTIKRVYDATNVFRTKFTFCIG